MRKSANMPLCFRNRVTAIESGEEAIPDAGYLEFLYLKNYPLDKAAEPAYISTLLKMNIIIVKED